MFCGACCWLKMAEKLNPEPGLDKPFKAFMTLNWPYG